MKPNPIRGALSSGSRCKFVAGLGLLAFITGSARSLGEEPATLRQQLKATPFRIAWEAYADGNSDIFVANADGSDAINLTHTPTIQEHYPRISPNGELRVTRKRSGIRTKVCPLLHTLP